MVFRVNLVVLVEFFIYWGAFAPERPGSAHNFLKAGALREAGATHTLMGLLEQVVGSIQKRETNTIVVWGLHGITWVAELDVLIF